jgi:hypothetical protein
VILPSPPRQTTALPPPPSTPPFSTESGPGKPKRGEFDPPDSKVQAANEAKARKLKVSALVTIRFVITIPPPSTRFIVNTASIALTLGAK